MPHSAMPPGYRRALWFAIILPALSLGGFEYVRHSLMEGRLGTFTGNLIDALLVALWGALYGRVLIRMVEAAHHDLAEARRQTAVLAERDRIARAMHDGLSQSLFFINVKLKDAAAAAESGEQTAVVQTLGQVQTAVGEAYGALRASISDLRRHPARPADLASAVTRLAQAFEQQGGPRVELALRQPLPDLAERRQEHLLAVLQEALTNVRKHAGAQRVSVRLARSGPSLVLSVTDNGRGMEPADSASHFGIPMMQERAALLGGSLTIRPRTGGGTCVELVLPVQVEEAVQA